MNRIGAHISISKGLSSVLDKAVGMGANCIQIFSASPRMFGVPKFTDWECSEFRNEAQRRDIGPNFIHATYLINLASSDRKLRTNSTTSLVRDLIFADKIGSVGAIVHTGSHKGKGFTAVKSSVVSAIKEVLAQTPKDTKLLLEIASGGEGKVGSTFDQLNELLQGVNDSRLGVCLDTAHMFAGGIEFSTPTQVDALSTLIAQTVGWKSVACIHANDSKAVFNSCLDRHENIGMGCIGKGPFKLLLVHPKFKILPFILETPGFDDKGPDKQNIDILKSLL